MLMFFVVADSLAIVVGCSWFVVRGVAAFRSLFVVVVACVPVCLFFVFVCFSCFRVVVYYL